MKIMQVKKNQQKNKYLFEDKFGSCINLKYISIKELSKYINKTKMTLARRYASGKVYYHAVIGAGSVRRRG